MGYTVARQIGIDAGHRIASHGSKCRHLHGHRYLIEARCSARQGRLRESGEESGMVLDFGFLKEEMMAVIDAPCDHGLIADIADSDLLRLFVPPGENFTVWHAKLAVRVAKDGFVQTFDAIMGQKLYLIPYPPTAECLARHWFERLGPAVERRSRGWAELLSVVVWETPNCFAEYAGVEPGF